MMSMAAQTDYFVYSFTFIHEMSTLLLIMNSYGQHTLSIISSTLRFIGGF